MSGYAGTFNPGPGTTLPAMGQSRDEIAKAVAAEIEAEIAGQVSPLEDLIRQYGGSEEAAIQKLNELYGSIQPSVQNAAANLRADFDKSISFEKGIFDATQSRLAGIRQQAGANAQALAQQLGAPVPVSLFDMGSTMEAGLGATEGAGSLLTASGMRDAALAEAEAFSGRVFPLMRKEAEEDTRRTYRSQIMSLEKEIATIRKMKPGLINERTRQRLLEERGYQLERAKAQRDWSLAQYSTKLEAKKLNEARAARIAADKLSKRAQDLQAKAAAAGETTTRRGQDLDAKAKAAALAAEKAQRAAGEKEYQAKKTEATRSNISAAIQAFIQGTTAKLKTVQKDPDTGSYVETVRTEQTGQGAITNPNQLLEAVRAAVPGARGMPDFLTMQVASALRAQGIEMPSDWVEGQAAGKGTEKNVYAQAPTRKAMNSMSLKSLETWAKRNMGFKGGYPKSTNGDSNATQERRRKSWLINWIARMEVEAGGPQKYGPR